MDSVQAPLNNRVQLGTGSPQRSPVLPNQTTNVFGMTCETAVTFKEVSASLSRCGSVPAWDWGRTLKREHHVACGPNNLSMASPHQLLLEHRRVVQKCFNHSSSHGMRREAGPLGVPWPGGMQVLGYTGLKPKVYNSNKTQKQVLSKFIKRLSNV